MNEYIDLDHKVDKSKFGPGEWQDEPDKVVWKDDETNLDCMIMRNRQGNWYGYVGIPLNHPLTEKHYNELEVDVHGGLTYGDKCSGHICHKSDVEVFWFGFDCGHAEDYSPINHRFMNENLGKQYSQGGQMFARQDYEIYRDINYVKSEVTSLAKQIKELL